MFQRFTALMILTLGSAAIPACVTRGEFNKEQQARRAAEEQRDGLERHVTELQEERRRLAAELDRLRTQVQDQLKVASEAGLDRARYREKLDELERRLAALGEAASAEGHSGDVTVFQTAEGTVVEIKEGILFDSGKKDIKAKGKEILDRVAAEIARTEYKLRVEGHTDADPVKVHAKEYPHGNLQLSAERAVEVASYLTGGSKSAIDEGRVSVAGYGPNRPKSTDKSTEGKRQNRRVDIVILNASMGVIDAASVTKPAEEGK